MSTHLDRWWTVFVSRQTSDADRCVHTFWRPEGSFGIEGLRRGPEDMGAWTPITYFSGHEFSTDAEATAAARQAVPWPGSLLDR